MGRLRKLGTAGLILAATVVMSGCASAQSGGPRDEQPTTQSDAPIKLRANYGIGRGLPLRGGLIKTEDRRFERQRLASDDFRSLENQYGKILEWVKTSKFPAEQVSYGYDKLPRQLDSIIYAPFDNGLQQINAAQAEISLADVGAPRDIIDFARNSANLFGTETIAGRSALDMARGVTRLNGQFAEFEANIRPESPNNTLARFVHDQANQFRPILAISSRVGPITGPNNKEISFANRQFQDFLREYLAMGEILRLHTETFPEDGSVPPRSAMTEEGRARLVNEINDPRWQNIPQTPVTAYERSLLLAALGQTMDPADPNRAVIKREMQGYALIASEALVDIWRGPFQAVPYTGFVGELKQRCKTIHDDLGPKVDALREERKKASERLGTEDRTRSNLVRPLDGRDGPGGR